MFAEGGTGDVLQRQRPSFLMPCLCILMVLNAPLSAPKPKTCMVSFACFILAASWARHEPSRNGNATIMQTIWTRVAQVRGSCRCPQCRHAAQRVSRSAGTANANAIRPQYWTSSTLWYSGIFAAAATFDASVKQRRREQWDQAIADVKQELGQAMHVDQKLAARHSAHSASPDALREGQHLEVDGLGEVPGEGCRVGKYAMTSRTDETLDDAVNPRAPVEENLATSTSAFTPLDAETQWKEEIMQHADSSIGRRKRATWPANTGHDLNVFHLPAQSIYAEDPRKREADASRWSEKKLKTVEMVTELLLMTFFAWLRHREAQGLSCEDAARAVPPEFAGKIRHYAKLRMHEFYGAVKLKAADVQRLVDMDPRESIDFQRNAKDEQLCKYMQDDLGHHRSMQNDMNTAMRELFDQADSKALEAPQYLAKVFYNLSVSTAPPNMDTYNTLITRLHHLGHTLLTRATIISFLRAHLRPNEVSLAAILNFRTDTDDEEGFRYIVERMSGAGKRGEFLMEAGPWTKRPAGSWYHGNRIFARDDGRMVQKAYATPMVFNALVRGVLRFNGFEEVLRVTRAWAKEGWGLDVDGFSILLKDCVDRGDWTAGLAVWRQIEYLQKKRRTRQSEYLQKKHILRPAKISLWTLADMLQLCIQAGDREEFDHVMDIALKTHAPEVRSGILTNLVKKKQGEYASKRLAERNGKEQDSSSAESERLPTSRLFNVFEQFSKLEYAGRKHRALKATPSHLDRDELRETGFQQACQSQQHLSDHLKPPKSDVLRKAQDRTSSISTMSAPVLPKDYRDGHLGEAETLDE
ncbi:uncharacterized protein MYCFIDRAFT_216622 [Pseudocercospora fijiensis CIRAD86]|uniref:Pentatricopeptide repeat protein n=1 Tax=Pseudocercospora fijiensis (strain CIRAD86) TaxID=383855 RepID=M3AMN0_PSEFD|nr:uncharacterized protein MYCFIDRAFT_216622 [Pseudocercospora fijiensis CIRAD86]EME78378.1 hypothetical protein MYCFIDRAFT_216622 [Pseudocercospora fijiensis CIRAD86]